MGAQAILVTGVLLYPVLAVVAEVALVLVPALEALVGPARSGLATRWRLPAVEVKSLSLDFEAGRWEKLGSQRSGSKKFTQRAGDNFMARSRSTRRDRKELRARGADESWSG
jgi:hypothetical protein